MNSIVNLWTTAQTPSGFAMPTCGHASIRASIRATGVVPGATEVIVRDRREDSVVTSVIGTALAGKRDAARTLAYFPGTTAWRPPIC
ncbi:hypothetical protein QWY28_18300 [Nocardioides sp. SOB77]|uniref:Uncharacterized protein n=1 Tax=Nocardioides oceani TaxID=3058369 RepID=A0ABT8FK89_9ACTN|nr:hypothetical protein [Nocardioides oceani]MDN4174920.1 hypothetical protein [Nocardioides oceani]